VTACVPVIFCMPSPLFWGRPLSQHDLHRYPQRSWKPVSRNKRGEKSKDSRNATSRSREGCHLLWRRVKRAHISTECENPRTRGIEKLHIEGFCCHCYSDYWIDLLSRVSKQQEAYADLLCSSGCDCDCEIMSLKVNPALTSVVSTWLYHTMLLVVIVFSCTSCLVPT